MGRTSRNRMETSIKLRAPALDRGLDILEWVRVRARPVGFGEIQTGLGIPPSTTVRLLEVLVAKGYLQQVEAGKYRVGEALLKAALPVTPAESLQHAAAGVLAWLSESARSTSLLLRWDGQFVECLAKNIAPDSVTMQPLGSTTSDLNGSPWCALIHALLDDKGRKQAELLSSDPVHLHDSLAASRADFERQGYQVDSACYPGLIRWGAVIQGAHGELLGAIGLGSLANNLDAAAISHRGQLTAEAAARISRQMGYRSSTHPTPNIQ